MTQKWLKITYILQNIYCRTIILTRLRFTQNFTLEKNRLLYNGFKKIPSVFSDEDINKIIFQIMNCKDYFKNDYGTFMRYRDMCLISTIYILGLRPKEACCLKFSDFDFRKMLVKINGKNNKTRKDRILPLPKLLKEIYVPYFKMPRNRFWRGSEYLFPSAENNYISPGRLKHIFREKILKPLNLWVMPEKGISS